MEEAVIIAKMRSGTTDVFTEIVEKYQTPILRYLFRLTGNYQLAQDLAQDTFIQAYKSILKTNSDLQFKAWLYRIATNNALQYHRRKRVLSFLPFNSNKIEEIPSSRNPSEITDEKIVIRETLRKVNPKHRTSLVLHYVEGFKYREIAEILGVSEEGVRKRVARGKEEFRKYYEKGGDTL
jgi:RNA polymerase sigma-70 factor (ECF subfamily)